MNLLIWVGPNATADVDDLVTQFDQVILFEPLQSAYKQLKDRYRKIDHVEIVNCGCGDSHREAVFNIYNAGLSSSFFTVTDQAVAKFQGRDWKVKTQTAWMVNLGDFLSNRGITTIDKLVIDAQGFDLTILKTIEPWLVNQSVKQLTTEADMGEFRHYKNDGNSFESQKELLNRCGYVLTNKSGAIHGDCNWEPSGNESQIFERLEWTFNGSEVR